MSNSPLSGKGVWIRRIVACEQGNLDALVSRAQAAGFTHVLLKIADGAEAYNADPLTGDALALTRRLRDAGLSVWGWHYVYGDKPRFKGPFQTNYHTLEAERAAQVVNQLREAGLQGYVINAEGEYERAPSRADKAAEFVARVRAGLGDFPLALASWKFPNSHKRFPWTQFRQHCVLDLPQVFWLGRHREAATQLEKSFQQYAALTPRLPYVPVAPALFENGWRPTTTDIEQFIARAQTLGLPGFSLWAWDYLGLHGNETSGNPTRLDFRAHWQIVADAEWQASPPAPPERMPDEWAAELADLTADETDLELPIADIETGLAIESIEATPLELTSFGIESGEPEPLEDLSDIAFGLPIAAPESAFTPEPLPASESDEIRARVQDAAERYTDSFRDLRATHRDQFIALGAQSLLGAPAPTESESPTITLAGQVVGEASPIAPSIEDKAAPSTVERMPDEWVAELETLTATDADDDADVPDWLREAELESLTEDDAEPTRPFAPEAIALELMPDEWVAELETLTATDADDDADVPDWLREAELESLTEDDAEPTRPFAPEAIALELMPDEWVAELETLTATDADDDADVPDWLRESESEALTEDDAEPTRPFAPEAVALELTPDEWVAELETLTATDANADEDTDLPEWLRPSEVAELTDDDAEPARPFAPEAIALELMPDEWVAELETLTATDANVDEDTDLPEWLRPSEVAELTDDDAEPARPFAPEAIALELMPDEWVAELETLTATDANVDEDTDLPEWLRPSEVAELTDDDAEPARPFAPETVALELMPEELVAELEALTANADDDSDLPDWLLEAEAIELETLTEDDAEPTRPFAPEAAVSDLIPDELVAELESLKAGEEDESDTDLPEWLQDFDIEAIEARLSEEDAEPARPFAPEPEAAIGTLIAPLITTTSPTISKLFSALSQGRLEEAFRLYASEFTLVHARQMARDRAGLRRFYLWALPGLQRETLMVRSLHVNRLTVQAHWACQSLHGRIIEGADTFHLNRQAPAQIVYHHTTLDFDPDST